LESHYPNAFIDEIKQFFLRHLLAPYQNAARVACEACGVDRRYLTNYSLGAIFWDASYNMMKILTKKKAELRSYISCANNALVFKINNEELRCHRVGENGVPRGGHAIKRVLDQHYLYPEVYRAAPAGELMFGLKLTFDDGLVAANLLELRSKISTRGYVSVPLCEIFNLQHALPEFPEPLEPRAKRVVKSYPDVVDIELGIDRKAE
jgi:hypothetical protein